MHVCGQTLVLIDNDATVSVVSQKLVDATLKYMFYHLPGDRAFSVNTYEHDLSADESYMTESGDLVCELEKIEYAAKDSNLADTLCEVIMRWKESDFACRDILVFTDGLEGDATDHEKEELYYLLENSEYPVYVVMLEQENNAGAKKGLSAVAVTSGGRFFETDFPGSEASVDKQLSEKIYAAMDEYAGVHWGRYEEGDEGEVTEEPGAEDGAMEGNAAKADAAKGDALPDEAVAAESEEYNEAADISGKVIYEYDRPEGIFSGTGTLILAAALIFTSLFLGILGALVMMKKRRRTAQKAAPVCDDEEDLFGDYELGGMSTTELETYDDGGDTVLLSEYGFETEKPTRLLTSPSVMVTLTDSKRQDRCYRIMLGGVMSIGRGNCDVMISGDDALSKKHCELSEKDGEVYVKDLASSNGTRVNGVKVDAHKLADKDELTIGSRTYIVGLT